jgi:hypothetical protein
MKFLIYCFLLIGALLTSLANAQNSNLAGPYGQIGIGYQNTSPSFSNTSLVALGQSLNPNISVSNSSGVTGAISAGYNFSLSPALLVGIGLDFSPFSTQSATASASYSGPLGSYQNSASVYIKNTLNLFVSPGIALDQNKLLYAKVGYTGASANGVNTDFYMGGTSFGFGYKQIINSGVYGFAEYNYVNYGSLSRSLSGNLITPTKVSVPATLTSTVSATSTNLLIGLGYRF